MFVVYDIKWNPCRWDLQSGGRAAARGRAASAERGGRECVLTNVLNPLIEPERGPASEGNQGVTRACVPAGARACAAQPALSARDRGRAPPLVATAEMPTGCYVKMGSPS